ncbi:MAG TPA: hypothetical protein EYO80_05770, partial [Candidatus Marinimicrobia bacterium]|nr:hypothetical protein [Candidatus Neomarinimicrobiota bacterium]
MEIVSIQSAQAVVALENLLNLADKKASHVESQVPQDRFCVCSAVRQARHTLIKCKTMFVSL